MVQSMFLAIQPYVRTKETGTTSGDKKIKANMA
jgi:hypothetical protein